MLGTPPGRVHEAQRPQPLQQTAAAVQTPQLGSSRTPTQTAQRAAASAGRAAHRRSSSSAALGVHVAHGSHDGVPESQSQPGGSHRLFCLSLLLSAFSLAADKILSKFGEGEQGAALRGAYQSSGAAQRGRASAGQAAQWRGVARRSIAASGRRRCQRQRGSAAHSWRWHIVQHPGLAGRKGHQHSSQPACAWVGCTRN